MADEFHEGEVWPPAPSPEGRPAPPQARRVRWPHVLAVALLCLALGWGAWRAVRAYQDAQDLRSLPAPYIRVY